MKTVAAVTTTTAQGSPDAGAELTSRDYYFDSYSHFGKLLFLSFFTEYNKHWVAYILF